MNFNKYKSSYRALAGLLALPLIGIAACGDDINTIPGPGGLGGYDPGDGGPPTSGSGNSGASGLSSGNSGSGGSVPMPEVCDDAYKQCPHEFSLADMGQTSVEVRGDFGADTWNVGVPMMKQGGNWVAVTTIPYNKAVAYKFVVNGGMWINDPGNPNTVDDGFGGKNSLLMAATCAPLEWTCALPPPSGAVEAWKDEVLYFVFVDRFLDGNPANNGSPTPGVLKAADYNGGDWQGVINKIKEGYFSKLGVTSLWLTVPMNNTEVSGLGSDTKSYSAYHGYWPKDFEQVEEHFGDMAKLKELVNEAHAAGLKVLYDYAANHAHDTAPIYQMHQNDGWFWANSNGNGGNCVCGDGCAWDPPTAEKCWFTSYLPDFNYDTAAARKYSVDNAIWWFQQTGIDGYRLDALKHMSMTWLTDLRARVKSDIEPSLGGKHFYMVGETYTGDKGLIKKYVNPDTMLDGQFDFPLRADLCSTILMRQGTMQQLEASMNSNDGYYGNGVMSTFLGNHDLPRIIHLAEDTPVWNSPWDGGKDKNWSNQPGLPGSQAAFERVANGFTVLMTTQGVPLIYYGDEVGLPGAGDPDNRRFMQWSNYSAGQLLLRGHIEALGQIRKDHVALRRGKRTPLWASADTMAYKMSTTTPMVDNVIVAINRGNAQASVGNLPNGTYTDLLTNTPITINGGNLNIPARKSIIFAQ